MNPISGSPFYVNTPSRSRSNRSIDPFRKDSTKNILFPLENTTMFISEKERFETDFAAQERKRRAEENQRKMEINNKKRENIIEKEVGRWESLAQQQALMNQKLENKRSKWKEGQKNNPSEAFNPITLEYDPTSQGEYLRRKDEIKDQRAKLRLYNIDAKRNSAFNIINGAAREGPPQPRYLL